MNKPEPMSYSSSMDEQLGRFGHHPNPAIDFCCEVEAIEGEIADHAAGLSSTMDLYARIEAAMQFRVGGDRRAFLAKCALRTMANRFLVSIKEQP